MKGVTFLPNVMSTGSGSGATSASFLNWEREGLNQARDPKSKSLECEGQVVRTELRQKSYRWKTTRFVF